MSSAEKQGYSANVEINLETNGLVLEVSQVGEDLLILQQPCDLPPTNGRIEIIIDGERKGYPVLLHQGASRNSRIVHFVDCFAAGSTGKESVYDQLTHIPQVFNHGRIASQDDVPF